MHYEKKQLVSVWKSSLVYLQQKNEALQNVEHNLQKRAQRVLELQNENGVLSKRLLKEQVTCRRWKRDKTISGRRQGNKQSRCCRRSEMTSTVSPRGRRRALLRERHSRRSCPVQTLRQMTSTSNSNELSARQKISNVHRRLVAETTSK